MSQNTRKRAAPGASPMVPYQQQRMQQPFGAGNGVNDAMMQWNGNNNPNDFMNPAGHDANTYGLVPGQQTYGQVPAASNSMALVPAQNRAMEPWAGFGGDGELYQPNNQEGLVDQDNVEALEEMAQKVKREARSKRKSIPPFVQKLSR